MAIYKFEVNYDSESGRCLIVEKSDNFVTEYSGSSYLRIKPHDQSFRGQIASHHDHHCPEDCKTHHLHFYMTPTEKENVEHAAS